MKTSRIVFTLGLLVLLSTGMLLAETDSAREMDQLQDQHTKDVAAATESLNRRYQASLEQLLKRATQANDPDTVARVQEQLTALSAGASTTGKPHYTKETLPQLLTTSEWTWTNKPEDRANPTRVTFSRDQLLMGGKPVCMYKVIDAFTVQLDKRVLKFASDHKTFEVPTWNDGTPRYGRRVN